ncbi:MAG: 30S ribosomal protein S4 [Euryarchaeota archaeon]|nr:30S ribosomal protein S4 [Euryarchaeota archaeon]
MGDPKFSRSKYETPSHPWQAARIKEENELLKKYGLKNKTEVWKAQSYMRSLRRQARELQARLRTKDPQAEKEYRNLIKRVSNLAMLPENAVLDDVLALNIESVLGRRLQTLVYQKGLAGTLSQARQMIVHGHIGVGGHKVRIPGYLVTSAESETISYGEASPFTSELHPMRPKLEPRPESAPEAPKAAVDLEKQKLLAKVEELAKKGEQIEHGG